MIGTDLCVLRRLHDRVHIRKSICYGTILLLRAFYDSVRRIQAVIPDGLKFVFARKKSTFYNIVCIFRGMRIGKIR